MFEARMLEGQRILITGGGTGLGFAMAQRFASLGADPIIAGRRQNTLEEAAEKLKAAGSNATGANYVLDQRDPEAVEETFDAIFADGPLQGLVNNAAANFVARTKTLSHRAVNAILQTSLNGALYCTLAAGKRWIELGQSGTILSIVTSYAWHGSPYVVPSAMAKSGLLTMTRSLASEWGPHGIRTVAIAPGSFETEGAWERLVPDPQLADIHTSNNSMGRGGRPEELANLAAFLMSPMASYIHGECVTIDGGRWLKGASTFGFLDRLDDADWDAMRAPKTSA